MPDEARNSLNPEDRFYFERWRRLSPKAKEALIHLAEEMEKQEGRNSLVELLKQQSEISQYIIASRSLGWFTSLIVKAAGLITALGVIFFTFRELR